MTKVQKDTLAELMVNFRETFEGATVEEATEKAHSSKKPSDDAEVTITDKRFVRSNIKLIGEKTNDNGTKDTQGFGVEAGEASK
mgnify:FL=1|tara:strand:+ start:19 stop:270 length:252 start_codon:yes stop_codon:yes gene_type:complete